METIGGRTESPTENFWRSTRRVRKNNSKSITPKLNESKDQENVNDTSLVQSKVDASINDEITKSSTLDAKVHNTTSNLNSSTPRRKKDPLANLHSNLSPKYIGFTTPPNQLNSSKEERTRNLRRRHNISSNNEDTSEDKDKEADITFTPNNESTVGFVRRTPRNRDSQLTPDNSIKRKEFVSPIDKLLIKNGAVMENIISPLADNDEVKLSDKQINFKSENEINEFESDIKGRKIYDEKTESKGSASTSNENNDEINKQKQDEEMDFNTKSPKISDGKTENASTSSENNDIDEQKQEEMELDVRDPEINDEKTENKEDASIYSKDNDEMDEHKQDEEMELNVEESEINENTGNKEDASIYSEDNDEINEHKQYEEEELDVKGPETNDEKIEKEKAIISSENNDEINEDEDNVSISTEIAIQIDDEEGEDDLSLDDKEEIRIYNLDENEIEVGSSDEEDSFDEAIVQSQPDGNSKNSPNETKSNMEELKISVPKDETEIKQTENQTEEEEIVTDKVELKNKSDFDKHSEDKNKTTKRFSPVNESAKESLGTAEKNENVVVKFELESVENESNNEFAVNPSATVNSPSAVSMDSAKGSSIINEGSWISFSTGDLYWGQIYNYCYWPCMVCPDPDGKTITTEEVPTGDQTVLVHVRFFADNGRRNWVKRENLMPYTGIENYQERIVEVREKYGPKSAKYKLYVPAKRKEQVWFEAVNEANIVAEVTYAKRLDKFYEIFEKSKAFHKLEKQRRKSIYISVNSGTGSDIESFYGSNDNINNLSVTAAIKQKRERSISPYSPAYSPIKPVAAKRRKLSGNQQLAAETSSEGIVVTVKSEENKANTDLNLSQSNSVASTSSNSLNDLELFNSLEFRKFYAVMKDFVMEQNHNEKLEKSLVVAVRNIWALKQLGRRQMERKLRESLTETDMSPTLALAYTRPTGEGSVKRLSSRLKTLMVRKSLMAQQDHEPSPERSITPKPSTKEMSTAEKIKKPINRPILEVIDDIFELDTKYLFKGMSRDPVCKYCFKPGGNLKKCAKNCTYWLHSDCLYKNFNKKVRRGPKPPNGIKTNSDSLSGSHSSSINSLTEVGTAAHVNVDSNAPNADVVCKECASNEPAKCMVCSCTESKKENDPLVKCCMAHCERAFHPGCCKYWPQAKITISKNHIESFRCPSHVCHTCVSDDPKGKFQHLSNSKLTKCVKCPATFHTDSTCIPAGSQILTAAHIICPRHSSTKHDMTVNVNWCFICVEGGQVVCCETCPTAVHANCLKIPIAANEGYICEECESGRMPLYGEMVWAKFNNFRWWPAIILPPTEIPKNIARKTHNPSDFVVRFFGTHDHGWISRRRVYLYLEGDSSEPPKSKSGLDLSYNKGVEEAKEVYEIIKAKNIQQRNSNENKEKLHPQPYVRIKANRAVLPVRLHVDIESVSKCECDPREENPCGPDTNCLNRVLYHECNPKLCPAGERCQNQMFESRISPRLDVVYMKERGFGLVCREPIKAGSFVIEYVGEVIDDHEFQARVQQKSRDRDENFYFLSVEKDYIIDAGPKGNLARFMNHSCDPNCETQKWSVNSLNRVGLFAIKDIPENTELTFNYHWDDLLGNEKKTCYCGAKKCAGQIGAKIKDLETVKEPTTVNGSGKSKSKTKTKLNKKLLNGELKKKLGSKLKLKSKTKTMTKKKSAAAAVPARIKAKAKSTIMTKSKAVKEESDTTEEEVSTSRLLISPDIFS